LGVALAGRGLVFPWKGGVRMGLRLFPSGVGGEYALVAPIQPAHPGRAFAPFSSPWQGEVGRGLRLSTLEVITSL